MRRERGWIVPSLAAVGAVLLVTILAGRQWDRRPSCRNIMIPAYVPPDAVEDLARRSTGARLIIINPASGPGSDAHSRYRDAVRAAQAVGALVLGYVPTGRGTRDASEVRADIDRYEDWYQVDGIFLDEASSGDDQLGYYRALSRDVRASRKRLVVLNPGVVPARGYFDIADIVVTFEGRSASYAETLEQMPPWLQEIPRERIAHLVYGASRAEAIEAVQAVARVGYIYVTSGSLPNPWRTLPAYLQEEEDLVGACS
jgi:hypothetical protein